MKTTGNKANARKGAEPLSFWRLSQKGLQEGTFSTGLRVLSMSTLVKGRGPLDMGSRLAARPRTYIMAAVTD